MPRKTCPWTTVAITKTTMRRLLSLSQELSHEYGLKVEPQGLLRGIVERYLDDRAKKQRRLEPGQKASEEQTCGE